MNLINFFLDIGSIFSRLPDSVPKREMMSTLIKEKENTIRANLDHL
jgi:hypothetical protein